MYFADKGLLGSRKLTATERCYPFFHMFWALSLTLCSGTYRCPMCCGYCLPFVNCRNGCLLFRRESSSAARSTDCIFGRLRHLHSKPAFGNRTYVISVAFAVALQCIKPVLFASSKECGFIDDFQHLEDERSFPVLVPRSLERFAAMSAGLECVSMHSPTSRDQDRRTDVALAVNEIADGINARHFGISHDVLPTERLWSGPATVLAHVADPLFIRQEWLTTQ